MFGFKNVGWVLNKSSRDSADCLRKVVRGIKVAAAINARNLTFTFEAWQ